MKLTNYIHPIIVHPLFILIGAILLAILLITGGHREPTQTKTTNAHLSGLVI